MAEITEEELLELKDAFDVYSKGSAEGMVDLHELGKLFLSLGQKLSEEELKKMLTDLRIFWRKKGRVNLWLFL